MNPYLCDSLFRIKKFATDKSILRSNSDHISIRLGFFHVKITASYNSKEISPLALVLKINLLVPMIPS